jgi:hypothetical protein
VGTVRVLRTSKTTLQRAFYLDEVATDATGAVQVTVTRDDGTVLQSGAATGPDVNHQYSYLFNGSDVVDRVTVSWSATVGGDAVILDQDVIEIAGGFYFGLAEARQVDAVFANTVKYPTADVVEVRTQTEDEAEIITGQAFVPRFEREVLTGTGDRPLRLRWPRLRKVRALTVGGSAFTSTQLAGIGPDPLGLIRTLGTWPWWGVGNVVVEYEHGMDRPPPDVVRAAKTRWRSLMFERRTRTPLPDRSEAFARTEAGLVKYGQEGADATGIPAVDAVYARWMNPRPGFG